MAANHLTNVTVVEQGMSDHEGTTELREDTERYLAADLAVRSFYGPGNVVAKVDVTTFDAWWTDKNPMSRVDVVKIDVEGAEYEALRGMAASLEQFKPRVIGIEIREYLLGQAGVSEVDLRNLLATHGYSYRDLSDLDGNYVFLREAGGAGR